MEVYAGQDIEVALKQLKREVAKSGLIRELKLKGIAKSSERRRTKDRLSISRRKRMQRKREFYEARNTR